MIRGIFKLTTIMIALFLFMGAAGCNFPIEYDEGTYETDIFETSQEDNTCSGEPQNEKCYDSAYDMDADCYMTDMAADSVCGYTLKNDYSQEEFEKWLAEYPWDCDDTNPEIWANCLVPYLGESGQGCEALFQQVHAEGYDTFIPFGASFDLDQGAILGGVDPASDFTVHSGPDGEGSVIEFIPAPPATFAFMGVFPFQPTLNQCESSSTLSSSSLVIAILDYYVPYKTNQGRYGYVYFKDYDAVSGITIDWRTFKAAQCYDSAYDMDGDCCMDIMASDSVCGYEIKDKYSQEIFDLWLETNTWDCDDGDPEVCVCAAGCEEQVFNEKCYDSAYDMDGDCYMTDMAADSVCGYTLKNDYSQEEFEKWLAEYPWDCDDSDPDIWADCPASDDVLISEPTPTKTIEFRPTATEPPLTRPTPTETPTMARPTQELRPTLTP